MSPSFEIGSGVISGIVPLSASKAAESSASTPLRGGVCVQGERSASSVAQTSSEADGGVLVRKVGDGEQLGVAFDYGWHSDTPNESARCAAHSQSRPAPLSASGSPSTGANVYGRHSTSGSLIWASPCSVVRSGVAEVAGTRLENGAAALDGAAGAAAAAAGADGVARGRRRGWPSAPVSQSARRARTSEGSIRNERVERVRDW